MAEFNIKYPEKYVIKKRWTGKLPVALVYPNTYSIGMGNLAVHSLYSWLNSNEDVVCERVFLPDSKTGNIRSIESNRPLSDFKVIFVSVSFENDFDNLISMLKKGDVECSAEKRVFESIIVAGGPAVTINPNALSNIANIIFLGEVDDVLSDIISIFCNNINEPNMILNNLKRIDGVYIPSISKNIPKRHVVKNLNKFPVHSTIDARSAEFGDMFLIEVGRGCSYTCRYCSIPKIYNPFRVRSVDSLWNSAKIGLSMNKKIGLICPEILASKSFLELAQKIVDAGGRFSTSSIRADHVNEKVAKLLSLGGMKSVSIGVEAGNETMRSKLGKNISNRKIIDAVKLLTDFGLKKIKLYFMFGLPDETKDDLNDIILLTKDVLKEAKKGSRIEVVLSPFVPKPMTAFENENFANKKYLDISYDYIRPRLKEMGVAVSSRSVKDAEKEYSNSRIVF